MKLWEAVNIFIVKKCFRFFIRLANLHLLANKCIPENVHSRIINLIEDIEYAYNNRRLKFDIEKVKYEYVVLNEYSMVKYLNPGFNNKIYKIKSIIELEKKGK